MTERLQNRVDQSIIILFSILLFIPFLGSIHLFDWDEINFAEAAREMIISKNFLIVQINYLPFWEKPPLFIWMQVLSMKAFGINEFAARFPNAVCGTVTLLLLYNIGKKLYNRKFGLLWTLIYVGSVLPHFYFRSGIIDPWFNLFIFIGLTFFIQYLQNTVQRRLSIVLSGLFIGLAVLTKGPVAVLIFGLCVGVFFILNRFKLNIRFFDTLLFSVSLAFTGCFWFLVLIMEGRLNLIRQFIDYQIRLFNTQDSGHGGFLLYHFVVLLIGVFPASIFALRALSKNRIDSEKQVDFGLWMKILFWSVLILFTIVRTKIVHYSSLCYFPLTFLASVAIHHLIEGKIKWAKWLNTWLVISASIFALVVSGLEYFVFHKDQFLPLIKDQFAVANLKASITWSGMEFFVGVLLIVGVLSSILLFKEKKYLHRVIGIFSSSLIFVSLTIVIFTPRIEGYTQRAALEFYESLKSKDCYLETFDFKSYAYLFYSDKMPKSNPKNTDAEWLFTGKIDKPAYFVCKVTSTAELESRYPKAKKISEKNGFVFYLRNPEK